MKKKKYISYNPFEIRDELLLQDFELKFLLIATKTFVGIRFFKITTT
jgi:hypothetical protein